MSQLVPAELPPLHPRVDRRTWLAGSAAGLGLALCGKTAGALAADQKDFAARRLAYLKPLVYARADIDDWLAGRAFPFCKYDPELGYLHIDRDFKEGIDGAVCRY